MKKTKPEQNISKILAEYKNKRKVKSCGNKLQLQENWDQTDIFWATASFIVAFSVSKKKQYTSGNGF